MQECRFHVNDTDIHVGAGTESLLVQDNVSNGGKLDWSYAAMKEALQFEVGGFRFRGQNRGTVIRRNLLQDHGDGLCISPSSDTDMYENEVSNCADDGVEVDGRGVNIRLWNNAFKNCYRGISLSPTRHGPVYCIRNTCYGIPGKTWNIFKIQSYGPRGPMFLIHNSSSCPGGLKPLGGRGISWALVYTRNNIFQTLAKGAWGAAFDVWATRGPLDMDYDLFHRKAKWPLGKWNGVDIKDCAELRGISGQEKHSICKDPRFVDPAHGVFRTERGSPVIDHGAVIPGINDCGPFKYKGAAPDIGAVEHDFGSE